MTYVCKALTPAQQEALLDDVRAGITGVAAVEKYRVAKTTMHRLMAPEGLRFIRVPKVPEPEVREALLSGMTITEVVRALHVQDDRVRVIYRAMELPSPAERRAEKRRVQAARCADLAPTHTVRQIEAALGINVKTVRELLKDAGVSPLPYVRPAAKPKPTAPKARVTRTPKPAPIKRPKRPVRQAPLFDFCHRKHPITKSNRVEGTERECLVCRKRGINVSLALVPARDAMIADLLLIIEKEVAELTAELRPEMKEKAA
ncbi:hypothetical protein [Rathayibacter sp. AY2B9]|uniref:hypothetical protein n=1 Tax=Rathayibacter sp. AY2B9 TaxID=2080572 RepID=UPI000CE89E0F|nr:hypothetical protein [Rathayibacter sp. AY2B9]PPG34502.1 hypothetical protein C5C25_00325 [Rathayibacter sp. AY2B9]